jgi:formylglycine-generating enzyme required for sulfatase activity
MIAGLGTSLFAAASRLAEEAVVKPALKKGLEPFQDWLTSGYDKAKKERDLNKVFKASLKRVDAPVDDEDEWLAWAKRCGLDRLTAKNANELRQQFANVLLLYDDPEAPPPEELVNALRWPRKRLPELSQLLFQLRLGLSKSDEWAPLFQATDHAIEHDLLRQILASISPFQKTLVETPQGQAFRTVLVQQNLSDEEARAIELAYRRDLQNEFELLHTRGLSPAQLPKSIRLPLKDVYLELGVIPMRSEKEQARDLEDLLELPEKEHLHKELGRMQQRVSDVLANHQKLVIVGKPGSGKTVSLRFITLMLAMGTPGAYGLRLDTAYLPIYIRLADYAEAIKENARLTLETFLIDHIQTNYPGLPRQAEFLQWGLSQGMCMVLLDGLDEVGDLGDSLLHGKTLRNIVLEKVVRFSDRRCRGSRANRVVITSRLEGYRTGDLPGYAEMELSELSVPDEVEDFLLRWFTAYELEYHPDLSYQQAQLGAEQTVSQLLADIMRSESVQRLAMNPLLLTILAMIHEMGTRLPEQRVKLYETVTKTMVENWRQAQTRHVSAIYQVLPPVKIYDLLASLAYWLHGHKPGGTMPLKEWHTKISELLIEDEDDEAERQEMDAIIEPFLRHAREEVGLLTERSPGQLGFFHLTLEEYLAAVEIARQEGDRRREMVEEHWQNPRWQEVILLAAGQLMLMTSKALDTFINDLRVLEADDPQLEGRSVILAGKALVDVGSENFKRKVVRDVQTDLLEVMQDLDASTQKPSAKAKFPILARSEAADSLDALGYLPPDLHIFIPIPDTGPSAFYISKYPVTNAQYRPFVEADDYLDPKLWHGFPKFDENNQIMPTDWGDAGWEWYQKPPDYRSKTSSRLLYPEYWHEPRFGIARPGVPVVGVSWYEANAFCRWLQRHWGDPELGYDAANPDIDVKTTVIRLPTEAERVIAAGGDQPSDRYPWDQKDEVTGDEAMILQRANVVESGIRRTTPVSMYPLGASHPYGVMDMGGNVWEWMANYYSDSKDYLALRGGSWYVDRSSARLAVRFDDPPLISLNYFGFRVVVLPS